MAPGWRLGNVGAARSTEDWEVSECSYGYFGSKRAAAEVGSAIYSKNYGEYSMLTLAAGNCNMPLLMMAGGN